jgi:DNA-binding IclR family transcriptional regulator
MTAKPILVLGKVDEIFAHLSTEGELSAAELAERTGEPRSSTYRILLNLRQMGLVETGLTRGAFRLGLRFLALGAAVQSRFEERAAARPVMERVHAETGESVFLCIRRGLESVCVERLDGRFVQVSILRLGVAVPLHHGGGGPRAILAFEDDAFRAAYLDQAQFEAFTPSTIVTRGKLEDELKTIRTIGLAVSDEELTVGIAAIGAPFFDFHGRVRGSLAIAGVRPRILGDESDAMRAILLEAAAEVSRALGYELEVRRAIASVASS